MKLRKSPSLLAFLATLALADIAPAVSLLLDFGNGTPTGAASGADGLVSAGHQSGGISSSENTWNYMDTDNETSLVFGDNAVATGVTVITRGEVTAGNNIINFTTGASLNTSSLTGSAAISNTLYSGNRPGRNGVFALGAGQSTNAAIGSKITGLAAGSYTIYVVGRNTNNGSNDIPATFYLSTGSSLLNTFTFDGAGNTTTATASITNTLASLSATTYQQGVTYASFNVTLGENESIFLATEGTGFEPRGMLNSIQIVQVPEPSAAALVLGSLSLLAFRRRRA